MKTKLKIAIFHNLPASGAIKALRDNISFLKANGHTVDVYTTDYANETFTQLNNIVDNYFVYQIKIPKSRKMGMELANKLIKQINIQTDTPTVSALVRYKDFEKLQKQIAEEINSKNYDIVISEQDMLFTYTPAFVKYIKKPLIYFCQQPFRSNDRIIQKLDNNADSIFHKIYNLVAKKYVNLDIEYAQYANNILVNSYYSHENLLKVYGLNSQVSYLGVDTELFKNCNLDRENFILSVGVLTSKKGFDFLIRAVGKIKKEIRPKFIIVSYRIDASWYNYLNELAKKYNVELEVLENISYDDLVVLYNKAKLFVFAPYLEPFGLVPLEALACGTPVIGVREGGVRETVKHDVNGLLLDRDEDVFAEGITTLLTDQELWLKFSENSSNYINSYWTLDHAGERLLNHIYRVLEKEKR